MSSRAEKLRRRQHRKEKKHTRSGSFERVAADLAASFLVNPALPPKLDRVATRMGATVVRTPDRAAKMSEVLMEFIEPEWEKVTDQEHAEKLLTVAIVAWNASLEHGSKREKMVAEFGRCLPVEKRDGLPQVIDLLIARKEKMFPDIVRPILSFELTRTPSGEPHLMVMSGFPT